MPVYDFRCAVCGTALTFTYKSYRDYDSATRACSACGSADLKRIISQVNIGRGGTQHDYTRMDANQMLSVLESGDSRAVGEMMRQVGQSSGAEQLGENYLNAAEQLQQGASLSSVERDLSHGALGAASDAPLPKLPKAPKPSSPPKKKRKKP